MTLFREHLSGNPDAHPTATLARLMDHGPGLTAEEMDGIAAALDARWNLARHHDLDGAAMAMVMPTGPAHQAPTDPVPTWVIHREGTLLRLDVCRADTYTRLGAYPALAPLLASLRDALEAAGDR